MSLNAAERRATGRELAENLRRSGLTVAEVAADTGFTEARVQVTIAVAATSSPVDVWLLRDYLERAVIDRGSTPAPFSVLTEQSRAAAEQWFGLRTAPRHVHPA